jgi:DNA-directed RNA polymerase subunit RPC12/RpoP
MSVRCPKCGSDNVVGFKNSYKCFSCGYVWRKFTSNKSIIVREFSIPLWAMLLLISIIVIAVAVPASWFFLAQGKITIKAVSSSEVKVEVISPEGGSLGDITLNPGEDFSRDIIFKVTISGRPYRLEGIYIGYNPYPPKLFSIRQCMFGSSLETMDKNCTPHYMAAYGVEDSWNYYRIQDPTNFPTLEVGEYYFKITLYLEPSWPDNDKTFDYKIYVNFEKIQ